MVEILIPICPHTVPAAAVTLQDIFRMANHLAQQAGHTARFDARLVSITEEMTVATGGISIPCASTIQKETKAAVAVVLPAMEGYFADAMPSYNTWVTWLARQYEGGAILASNCTASFILASTGLLNGKVATTSWFAAEPFKATFPLVRLQEDEILIDSGRLITSAATTSYLNLAIYLIERLAGAELASLVSKFMLVDKGKPPQNSYSTLIGLKGHNDSVILRVQEQLEKTPHTAIPLPKLADDAALSVRTLLRRFKAATGTTPTDYRQLLRIEAAKQRLEHSQDAIKEIGYDLGFEDLAHFRHLFKRVSGVTPSDYRLQHTFRFSTVQRSAPEAKPAS